MFTGLVEEVGRISAVRGHEFEIACRQVSAPGSLNPGDSVAVNGVCLTVVRSAPGWLRVEVMPVTLQATTLGRLTSGRRVNLERALRLGDRLGGHLVSGHVDAAVPVSKVTRNSGAVLVSVVLPSELASLVVPRGSLALDGISLTAADVGVGEVTVSLVGHTRMNTALAERKPGELVNIECDLIGKHIRALIEPYRLDCGSGDRAAGAGAGTAPSAASAARAEAGYGAGFTTGFDRTWERVMGKGFGNGRGS